MKTPPISEFLTLRSLLALVIIISIGSISYSFGRAEGRYNAQTNLMLENQHAHDGEHGVAGAAHGVTGAAGLDAGAVLPRTGETLKRSHARAAFSAERQKLREQRAESRMHAKKRIGSTVGAGEAVESLRGGSSSSSSSQKGQPHHLGRATGKPQTVTSAGLKSTAASQVSERGSKATSIKSLRAKDRPEKVASKAAKAAFSSSNSSSTKPQQQQASAGGAKQKPA